jgi:hypothetical protein
MPAKVRGRVHALTQRANAKIGLKFTDSNGNDLDARYPDDDSNYDPEQDDNSSASSERSNSHYDDASNSDLHKAELAGVNEPVETRGVNPNADDDASSDDSDDESDDEHNNEPVKTTGVGDEPTGVHTYETSGVDDHLSLQEYVDELKAELDADIAGLDSDYEPNQDESDTELDNTFRPIDNEEIDNIHADATREQASADDTMPDLLEQDKYDDASLPKLRQR